MNQGSDKSLGLFALLKSSLAAANWKQWLPSRGNFIFVMLIALGFVWAQSNGVLARSAAQTTGYTRPFPYQGRLADASGTPLTNTYPMIFRLYASGIEGVPLWEENWSGPNSVQVSDGLFSVMLGSLTPIPDGVITENSNLWLGITVGTDDEMTPRIQLGSVPFSHQAQTVADGSITVEKIADGAVATLQLADNSITSEKLVDGSITGGKIATNAVSALNIANNSITSEKINDGVITSSKIADGTVSTADLANGSVTSAKLAAGAVNHIIMLDEPITVVSFHSRSTSRTMLNLSSWLPTTATSVLINLETNGKAYAWIPGKTNASITAQNWGFNQGWVRLSNRTIDYQLLEASTSGSDIIISIVGYLE